MSRSRALLAVLAVLLIGVSIAHAERLGVMGKFVEVGGKKGLGVDGFTEDSLARDMRVEVRSFIHQIEVKYGDPAKTDKRAITTADDVKNALAHEDISEITLTWRQGGVWYKNTYYPKTGLIGRKPTKIDEPK